MTHRLLFVEDDPETLEAAKAALIRAGYTVDTASTGAKGLSVLAAATTIDLVVVDLSLPDMGGLEFLREKNRREREEQQPRTQAIIVSGDSTTVDDARLWPDGVVGGLAKPYEPSELLAAVAAALGPASAIALGAPSLRAVASDDKTPTDPIDLRSALRARDDLLAVVCHDLRTPLTTIAMTAGNLMSRVPPGDVVGTGLETVLRAARQMRRLVQDLLDFSQLEASHLRIEVRRQRISDIVEQGADAARVRAVDRRIVVDIDQPARDVDIPCDRERIAQVLGNLLDNAIRYTPPAGQITVRSRIQDDEVRIEVTDSGPGIPATVLPHLFEPYRRGPAERSFDEERSLGLGLSIARGIVEAHGGRITAQSNSTGATFSVILPQRTLMVTGTQARPLLLVDDDAALRDEVADALTEAGYIVAVASDGKQALDLLNAGLRPALILLDLMMPVMTGWELLSQLKRDPDRARIPVIVVSALDQRRVEATLIDIAGYLEKPMHIEQLLRAVRAHAGSPDSASH